MGKVLSDLAGSRYPLSHILSRLTICSADLTPNNISESNYIYPYYEWYNLWSDSTNSLAILRITIQTVQP